MFLMMLPTLACATTSKMSRMEQDCCRQMHGKCGEMAKQGCCQIEVRSDLHQLPSHVVTALILPAATVVIAFQAEPPVHVEHSRSVPNEHSPPGLLVASTTVFRI